MKKIPFSKPYLTGNELPYIQESLLSGFVQGDGPFTHRCESLLEKLTNAEKHLLTHSCTGALELVALLLGLGDGDEVIMPSYTFVSTANAFVLHGATPVFVDIEVDTRNMCVSACESAITDKTRAIVAVNYGGMCPELDKLAELAKKHGIALIEDAAQSIGAKYKGKPLGAYGELSTFSFHGTKNIISGEGGSLAINHKKHIERAEILREKGTNRSLFMAGQVDKYTWVDKGSSFLPSDMTAACLLAQLEQVDEINGMRMDVWNEYHDSLLGLHADGRIELARVPEGCEHNAHAFTFLCRDIEDRDGFLAWMRDRGISATFHYVPLHSAPEGIKCGRVGSSMKGTDEVFERLVRLPLFPGVDSKRVIDATRSYLQSN